MELDPKDLSVSVIQNGTTWFPRCTGVSITHLPSNITSTSLDERSTHANKERAYQRLLFALKDWKPEPKEDKVVFYIRVEYSGTDTSHIGKLFRFLRSRFPFAIISKVERPK